MAEEITKSQLTSMEMHGEKTLPSGILCLRVVGGWIYWRIINRSIQFEGGETTIDPFAVAGVFVPEK